MKIVTKVQKNLEEFIKATGGEIIPHTEGTSLAVWTNPQLVSHITLSTKWLEMTFDKDFPLGDTQDGELIQEISSYLFYKRSPEGKVVGIYDGNKDPDGRWQRPINQIVELLISHLPLTREEKRALEEQREAERKREKEEEIKRWAQDLEEYLKVLKEEVERVERVLSLPPQVEYYREWEIEARKPRLSFDC